jgi:hypothetical protein
MTSSERLLAKSPRSLAGNGVPHPTRLTPAAGGQDPRPSGEDCVPSIFTIPASAPAPPQRRHWRAPRAEHDAALVGESASTPSTSAPPWPSRREGMATGPVSPLHGWITYRGVRCGPVTPTPLDAAEGKRFGIDGAVAVEPLGPRSVAHRPGRGGEGDRRGQRPRQRPSGPRVLAGGAGGAGGSIYGLRRCGPYTRRMCMVSSSISNHTR